MPSFPCPQEGAGRWNLGGVRLCTAAAGCARRARRRGVRVRRGVRMRRAATEGDAAVAFVVDAGARSDACSLPSHTTARFTHIPRFTRRDVNT